MPATGGQSCLPCSSFSVHDIEQELLSVVKRLALHMSRNRDFVITTFSAWSNGNTRLMLGVSHNRPCLVVPSLHVGYSRCQVKGQTCTYRSRKRGRAPPQQPPAAYLTMLAAQRFAACVRARWNRLQQMEKQGIERYTFHLTALSHVAGMGCLR